MVQGPGKDSDKVSQAWWGHPQFTPGVQAVNFAAGAGAVFTDLVFGAIFPPQRSKIL